MTSEAKKVYDIIVSHAPSYWWSPANIAFADIAVPFMVRQILDALTEQGRLIRCGDIAPLYALSDRRMPRVQ